MKTQKRAASSLTFCIALLTVHSAYAFYNPQLGSWANRDPIGEHDGPNLYAYVRNRAVNFVDTDGRTGWGPPFFPPRQPPEGATDCASRIAGAVARQTPFGTGDPSSRWNHCVASCRISRECPGGRFTAWIAGDWYQDPWWLSEKYSNSDPGDRAANQVGRDASKCKKKSCEESCNDAFNNGSLYPSPDPPLPWPPPPSLIMF